jgi:hypothetical protein
MPEALYHAVPLMPTVEATKDGNMLIVESFSLITLYTKM